jgi:hypothetical protein
VGDDRVGPVPQVDARDHRGHVVHLDGPHAEVEAREGHRVRADPAAQVVDDADLGAQVARGVPGGHLQPGRLLETVGGEQHLLGELAELVSPTGPQARLGQRRRDELGGEPGVPQPRLERQLRRRVIGRQGLQQPPALAADEQRDRGEVHPAILSHGRPPSLCRVTRQWDGSLVNDSPGERSFIG